MFTPWPFPDDPAWYLPPTPPPPADEDSRIATEVAERLATDGTTRCQRIAVKVQNRVVILAGTVTGPDARQVAASLAWAVAGVFDVCNALRLVEGRRH